MTAWHVTCLLTLDDHWVCRSFGLPSESSRFWLSWFSHTFPFTTRFLNGLQVTSVPHTPPPSPRVFRLLDAHSLPASDDLVVGVVNSVYLDSGLPSNAP